MGNHESSSTPSSTVQETGEQVEPGDIHIHYKELYADLTAPSPGSDGALVDEKVFRDRFVSYFGGPSPDYGRILSEQVFPEPGVISEDQFVKELKKLRRAVGSSDRHTVELFLFSAFSDHQESISKEGLTSFLYAAATLAITIGSELPEHATPPKDHPLLVALTEAAWVHADSAGLSQGQFKHWVSASCPGLLDGVCEWTLSLLTHGGGQVRYQLPTPSVGENPPPERVTELGLLVWMLSTIVPMIYMGHRGQGSKDKGQVVAPVGGEWTSLYSSDRHGLSMNRFQHHCSDYRHPSVLTLTCSQRHDHTLSQFTIALDTEWRDGTYLYGGEDSVVLQLRPTFRLLRRGPKLVSLNEKQRGFPTGLRVLQTNGSELLTVDSSLDQACFLGNQDLRVECVEVWGCGGVEAAESQRRMKEWEKRQISLRGKVKRAQLAETWESSPDRYLLEMGGVTTRRPKEQHQQ